MVSNENEMLTVFAERGDDVTLQNLGCFFDDHDRGTQLAKHSDVPELQEPEEWHEAKLMVVTVNMVNEGFWITWQLR